MNDPALTPRRRTGRILVLSMVGTVLVLRAWLFVSPNADFSILRFNVHHLFTGLIILSVAGVPSILSQGQSRGGNIQTIGFGVGLAMTFDEWIYLIVTDGSNDSYWLPASYFGSLIMIGLVCLYILFLSKRPAT